jgi:hypothetical protein
MAKLMWLASSEAKDEEENLFARCGKSGKADVACMLVCVGVDRGNNFSVRRTISCPIVISSMMHDT